MNPQDYNLPWPTFRPVQQQVLDWSIPTALERKVVLLEAPPGVGKSGIGVAWGKSVGSKLVVLAQTVSYLDQYHRTIGLPFLKGRGNFHCFAGGSCELACGARGCPSDMHKVANIVKPALATTYAYYLLANGLGNDVLVADEGHRLLDVMSDFSAATVNWEDLDRAGIGAPPDLDPRELKEWTRSVGRPALKILGRADPTRDPQAAIAWDRLDRAFGKMAHFDPLSEEYVHIPKNAGFCITPVWPTRVARNLWTSRNLVMSATLYGGHLLAELLGLGKSEYSYAHFPSPFDPARRPIFYLPVVALNRSSSDYEWGQMGAMVSQLLRRHPGKTLITVNSFSQAAKLARFVNVDDGHQLLVHKSGVGRQARSDLFTQFRNATGACSMISASAWEGEDFPQEQLRCHIIVKTLYPDMGDPLVQARRESGKIGKAWYSANACGNMAQAYGRIMRADDDRGYTYILDESFGNLWKYSRSYLPSYMKEAFHHAAR